MKILYKQGDNSNLPGFDIQDCYLKRISFDQDNKTTTKKTHRHNSFEIHIVTEGSQEYEAENRHYSLEKGSFLIIPPNTPHTVICSGPQTKKYSFTLKRRLEGSAKCFFGKAPERVLYNLEFILKESALRKEISNTLIENNVLEILVSLFRLMGIKERKSVKTANENTDISLAKQYIDDNIYQINSVSDVAVYCHFSTKQLTRLFKRFEDIAPGEYIIKRRIAKIEELLSDNTLSLKGVSSLMGFSNEYYFNTFFKKHFGMPPGEYKKMLGK